MVPSSRPTLVQKWTLPSQRRFCGGFLWLPLLLLSAHAVLSLVLVLLSSNPDLVLPGRCQGSRCRRDPKAQHTWYRDSASDLCGAMAAGETAPLKDTEIAFRFPKEEASSKGYFFNIIGVILKMCVKY